MNFEPIIVAPPPRAQLINPVFRVMEYKRAIDEGKSVLMLDTEALLINESTLKTIYGCIDKTRTDIELRARDMIKKSLEQKEKEGMEPLIVMDSLSFIPRKERQ